MPAGRPEIYTPELAERVLMRMYDGDSIRQICADDSLPSRTTVHLWRIRHTEFASQYARARRAQVEARIEEAHDIAEDGSNDYIATEEGTIFNAEHVQRSKLRVEQRRWEASKLLRGSIDDKPLDYGDKLAHTGADGEGPVIMRVVSDI
jgi:hypothetical protein